MTGTEKVRMLRCASSLVVAAYAKLGIGFWRWIPAIIALRTEETALRKFQAELKQRIVELTAERNKLKTIIECELSYAAQEAAAAAKPEEG